MAKDKDYKKLISSNRWQKLRKKKLSTTPLCENCKKEGIITEACEIHHIVPVETAITYADKERLMYNFFNLVSLCHNCHIKEHLSIGRGGRKARIERKKKQLQNFTDKFIGAG